jgi:hypothetical protein
MRAALIALLAALLGFGAAGLLACGGETRGGIPVSRASDLKDRLQDVRDAVDDGKCGRADAALARLRLEVERTPPTVRRRLRERLGEGVDALARQVPDDCAKAQSTESTATTDTAPEPTTTETAPPTQTTPVPTVSEPTVAPTAPTVPPATAAPTAPPVPTVPDGTGGISPEGR